jgi:hypothetical protein
MFVWEGRERGGERSGARGGGRSEGRGGAKRSEGRRVQLEVVLHVEEGTKEWWRSITRGETRVGRSIKSPRC